MGHRVTLMPSGHTFEVPEGQSILTAGLGSGCNLPYSCRSGCCLTCHGTLLEGEVDYGFVLDIYLTPERKAQGTVLLCQAKPLSDVVVEVHELSLQGIKPRTFPCKVRRIERVAPDAAIVTLRMPPFDNMLFAAGQYIDLLLEGGERRSYSVANAPEVGLIDLELHVRHTPGGLFTDRVFSSLEADERLQFEGPLGTFYLREESDKPIVFLASGTGFGPIQSIVDYALKRRIARPMTIYWGCRTKSDLYRFEKAEGWAKSHTNVRFVPVLSEPKAEDAWKGRTGFVHRAVMEDFPDLSGHQVYACGAPVMVEAARADFSVKCGLPPDEFFADAFLTQAEKSAGAPAGAAS